MNIVRVANNTVPTGNQFSNSTAENIFADLWILPQNLDSNFNNGRFFTFKVYGYVSSASSTPGTLTLKLKLGTTTLGTAIITLPASLSNAGFMLDGIAMICVAGTSGTVSCQGFVILDNAGTPVSAGIVNAGTGNAGQVTVNTQSQNNLGLSATFSVASTSNVVTVTQLLIREEF